MNYRDRIVRDRAICGGEPVFRGTRVTQRTVLPSLAEDASADEILLDFPTLSADDIRAAIVFAAAADPVLNDGKVSLGCRSVVRDGLVGRAAAAHARAAAQVAT